MVHDAQADISEGQTPATTAYSAWTGNRFPWSCVLGSTIDWSRCHVIGAGVKSVATSAPERYLFVVTGFDKEPDRTAGPLVLANIALAAGAAGPKWGRRCHQAGELPGVRRTARELSRRRRPDRRVPTLQEDPRYHRRDPGAECELDGAQALLAEMRCRQTLSF